MRPSGSRVATAYMGLLFQSRYVEDRAGDLLERIQVDAPELDAALPPLVVRCSYDGLPDGKIGAHHQIDGVSLVVVSPKAFEQGPEYVDQVLLHELLHVVVAANGGEKHHGKLFHQLAKRMGLKPHYRD